MRGLFLGNRLLDNDWYMLGKCLHDHSAWISFGAMAFSLIAPACKNIADDVLCWGYNGGYFLNTILLFLDRNWRNKEKAGSVQNGQILYFGTYWVLLRGFDTDNEHATATADAETRRWKNYSNGINRWLIIVLPILLNHSFGLCQALNDVLGSTAKELAISIDCLTLVS